MCYYYSPNAAGLQSLAERSPTTHNLTCYYYYYYYYYYSRLSCESLYAYALCMHFSSGVHKRYCFAPCGMLI